MNSPSGIEYQQYQAPVYEYQVFNHDNSQQAINYSQNTQTMKQPRMPEKILKKNDRRDQENKNQTAKKPQAPVQPSFIPQQPDSTDKKKLNCQKPPNEQNHERFLPQVKIPDMKQLPGNILDYKLFLAKEQNIPLPPNYSQIMWELNEYPQQDCIDQVFSPGGRIEQNMPCPSFHLQTVFFCPTCRMILEMSQIENTLCSCHEFVANVRDLDSEYYSTCKICLCCSISTCTLCLFALRFYLEKLCNKNEKVYICPKCKKQA